MKTNLFCRFLRCSGPLLEARGDVHSTVYPWLLQHSSGASWLQPGSRWVLQQRSAHHSLASLDTGNAPPVSAHSSGQNTGNASNLFTDFLQKYIFHELCHIFHTPDLIIIIIIWQSQGSWLWCSFMFRTLVDRLASFVLDICWTINISVRFPCSCSSTHRARCRSSIPNEHTCLYNTVTLDKSIRQIQM